jgi:RNA polymerase primary sigma factor
MEEIIKYKLLEPREEVELAALVKQGDGKAYDDFVTANLRLVIKIARAYIGKGLDHQDLISEGNIGLMRAILRFDPVKGGKLSTYASWWIKQKMRRALDGQSRDVRLPIHINTSLRKVNGVTERFLAERGRHPTDMELSTELKISERRLRNLRCTMHSPVSLDTPADSSEDAPSVHEFLADPRAETPFEVLERKSSYNTMTKALGMLTLRDREVLSCRFGLNGKVETLKSIGMRLGVTRERIRQIEGESLKKLRQFYRRLDHPLPLLTNTGASGQN